MRPARRLLLVVAALLGGAACDSPAASGTSDASVLAPDGGVDARGADVGLDASLLAADVGTVPFPADAALVAPDAAPPASADAASGTAPLWFLHLSDTHLGENTGPAPGNLQAFVRDVLPVIKPALTVHTGDVTDSGDPAQYDAYAALVSGKVAGFPLYSEIPGNHDVKTDTTADFLAKTPTGLAGGGVWGVHDLDTTSGRIRLVRTSTVDSGSGALRLLGILSSGQVDALLAAPASPVPVWRTLLAAHHPPSALSSTNSDEKMQQLLAHFAPAVYLCGHVHLEAFSWQGQTLVLQASTLGRENGSEGHFALGALDEDGPAARSIAIDYTKAPTVSWPLVLVTYPGNATLGGTNPVAKAVKAGASISVRALAFSPSGASSARVRLDQGTWTPMTSTDATLWTAAIAAPVASGKHTVEVSAMSAEGSGGHVVTVSVVP
ncbi:MAG: metallophosphoesterase [Myxococcales bacterium]